MSPSTEKPVQVAQLFVPEIKDALKSCEFKDLKSLLRSLSLIDLADAWKSFSPSEQILLFRLLSDRGATMLFEELDREEQSHLLDNLGDEELKGLVGDLKPEETAKLFNRLPARTVRSLSRFVKKSEQVSISELMNYPEHSVGKWMHVQQIELTPSLTTSQAIERIRTNTNLRKDDNTKNYYITDKLGRAAGYVSLRELIAAPSRTKLSDYMNPVRLFRLDPTQDPEDAIQLFTKYKLSMAPVADYNDKFIGYIQAEDIIPLVQKESTEDIQKLGAVEAFDEPYFKIAFFKMVQKRGAWLCVLFLGELLTATAMGFFEKQIAKAVVLALFIPLIISSGGNSGSQAATLIVRALALKEVGLRDWWRVIRREFASGLALGLILGTIGFLRIFIWAQFSHIYGEHYLLVASTVGVALVLVVMWGSLSGSLLPIILSRLGLDPAVVSAPFVATLVDVTGLIIYFSVAKLILEGKVMGLVSLVSSSG
jgi:magnesium transporter